MHLADAFIQSDLQAIYICIVSMYFIYLFLICFSHRIKNLNSDVSTELHSLCHNYEFLCHNSDFFLGNCDL